MSRVLTLIPICLLIAGCNSATRDSQPPIAEAKEVAIDPPEVNWTEGETSTDNAPASGEYQVKFETTAGDFTMLVHRDWAPRGAERMFQLIKSQYFDGAPFYRVVPGFMVQFGMCGDPKGTQYWEQSFPDEPVTQSNQLGMVSYAKSGPDTRSTQLFINYDNNAQLDGMGFSPFAEIIEGMNKVKAINAQYRELPDQTRMTMAGNEYIFAEFPKIDYIIRATFVGGEPGADATSGETTGESTEDVDAKTAPAPEDE